MNVSKMSLRRLLFASAFSVLLASNLPSYGAKREAIAAGPTGSISGQAVDAAGEGEPFCTITVLASGGNQQELARIKTDGTGKFAIPVVPVGQELIVKAEKKGKIFVTSGIATGVKVEAGKDTNVGTIKLEVHTGSE